MSSRALACLATTVLLLGGSVGVGLAGPRDTNVLRPSKSLLMVSPTAGETVDLRVEAVLDGGAPASGVTWMGRTSFGSLSDVEETAPGTFTARLTLPAADMPRTALVVFVPQDGAQIAPVHCLLPVHVRTPLSARTEPRSQVSAVVGQRTFGPVTALRDGTFDLDLLLPPGADTAVLTLTDPAGNATESRMAVPRRDHDPLTVVLDSHRVPSDGTTSVAIHAYAFDRAGLPLRGAPLTASATLGELSAFVDLGQGVQAATWRPPADGREGVATLEFTLASPGTARPLAKESDSVRIVRGPPARLALGATPTELVAGGDPRVELVARVQDAAGFGLAGLPVTLHAERGELAAVTEDGHGGYAASLLVPSEVRSGSIVVRAIVTTGAPSSLPVSLTVVANPKVVPTSWQAFSLLTATVQDSEGQPVEGEVVSFHVARGEGTVTPVAVTNASGTAVADFSADPVEEIVTIEASASSTPSLRATTTIEKRASGAFSIVSRPASLARGGASGSAAELPDGAVVLEDSVQLVLRAGTAQRLVASADPARLPADGESTASISALLTDSFGNGVADANLSFSADRGSLSAISGGDDGEYSATLTAPAGAGSGQLLVTVTDAASGLSATVTIGLDAGPATSLMLAAAPTRLPADGATRGLASVTLADATGVPVPGAGVTLEVADGDIALDASALTTGPDGRGSIGFTAGREAGPAHLRARYESESLAAEATLELLAVGPVDLRLTAVPDAIPADGRQRSELEVELDDGRGGRPEGQLIDFDLLSGPARLLARSATSGADGIARVALVGDAEGTARVRARSRSASSVSAEVDVVLLPGGGLIGVDAPVCAGPVTLRALDAQAVSWAWDWTGDTVPDATTEVATAPLSDGVVSVSLTTQDSAGTPTVSTRNVTVHALPNAQAIASASHVPSGGKVTLDGRTSSAADGGALSHAWDLDGDGTTDAVTAVVTDWARPDGVHPVRLTVEDRSGCRSSTTLVVAFGDLPDVTLELSSTGSGPVPAGATVEHAFAWGNAGVGRASNVVVSSSLPAELTPDGPLPAGCALSGTSGITCVLGDVAPGASGTFAVRLRAATTLGAATVLACHSGSISADEPDLDPSNNASSACTALVTEGDLVLALASAPACPARAGAVVAATVSVTNVGATSIDDGSVEVSWDPVLVTAMTSAPAASMTTPGFARFDLPPLGAGAALSGGIALSFTVAAVLPATSNPLSLGLSGGWGGLELTPADNRIDVNCTATAEPDLWVQATLQPDNSPGRAGDGVSYRLTYGNSGSVAATSVVVREVIDSAVLEPAILSNPDGGVLSTDQLDFFRGSVPADPSGGAFGILTYRVRLRSPIPPAKTRLETETTISGAEIDTSSANDSARTSLALDPAFGLPDVAVHVTAAPAVTAGDRLTFNIDVDNEGLSPAAGVVVTHDLSGAQTTTAGPLPADVTSTATGYQLNVGGLAAGARRSFRIDVNVSDPQSSPSPTLSSVLRATHSVADGDPSDDVAVHAVSIEAEPDLGVSVRLSSATAAPGATVQATVSLTSAGSAPCPAGLVTLSWPAALTSALQPAPVALPVIAVPGATVLGPFDVPVATTLPAVDNDLDVLATATCASGDRLLANNTASARVVVTAAPDLFVALSVPPGPHAAGDSLDVTASVANRGSTRATDVWLSLSGDAAAFEPVAGSPFPIGSLDPLAGPITVPARITVLSTLGTPAETRAIVAVATLAEADANAADNSASVELGLTAAPDLGLTITALAVPSPPEPGGRMSYTLRATNGGTTRALTPVLTVTGDQSILVGFAGAPPAGGVLLPNGSVQFTLLDIAPGQSAVRTLDMVLAATFPTPNVNFCLSAVIADAEARDTNLADNSRSRCSSAGATADLAVTLDVQPAVLPLAAGGSLRATVRVQNTGTADVTDGAIVLAYPAAPLGAGVTSLSAGGVDDGVGAVTWTGLTVLAGQTLAPLDATFALLSVLPAESNPFDVTATASTAVTEPNLANNLATSAQLALARAVPCVSVVATPTPSTPTPGGEIAYSVTLSNNGTTASGRLLAALEFDAAGLPVLVDAGGGALVAAGRIEWTDIPSLAAGAAALRTARLGILPSLPAANLVLDTTASVSATSAALAGDCSRTAMARTTVRPAADLSLRKQAVPSQSPPPRGASVAYRLSVTNDGILPSLAATLTDVPPSQMDVVAAPGATIGASTLTWPVPPLAPGATATFDYELSVRNDLGVGLELARNEATVAMALPDADPSNDSAVHVLRLPLDIDLVTTLSCGPVSAPALAGGDLTYVANIRNAGAYTATNVSLRVDVGALAVPVPLGTSPFVVPVSDLAPGTAQDVTFNVRSKRPLPDAANTVIVNVAAGSSDQLDADPATNIAQCSVNVSATVDLRVALTTSEVGGAAPVDAGDLVEARVALDNVGGRSATGTRLDVTFDTALATLEQAGDFTPGGVPGTLSATIPGAFLPTTGAGGTGPRILTFQLRTARPLPFTTNLLRTCATATSAMPDAFAGDNSACNDAPVRALPDLVVSLAASGPTDPILAGQSISSVLSVRNDGASDATGVVLTHVRDGARVPLLLSSDQPFMDDGTNLTFAVGTLAASASWTARFDLLAASTQPAVLANADFSACGSMAQVDGDPTSDCAAASVAVRAPPNAWVSQTMTPCCAPAAGTSLATTVLFGNAGSSPVTGGILDILIPADTLLVDGGGGVLVAPGVLRFAPLADLAPGSSGSRSITTRVAAALPDSSNPRVQTATITHATVADESDTSDDRHDQPFNASAASDLVVTISRTSGPPLPDGALSYLVTCRNAGTTTARSVTLSVTDSPLAAPVAPQLPSPILLLGDLAPGATAPPLTLQYLVASTLPQPSNLLTVSATASSPTADAVPADNTAAASDPLLVRPDLAVALQVVALPSPAAPGAELVATTTYSNGGRTRAASSTLAVEYVPSLCSVIDAGGGVDDGVGRVSFDLGTVPVGPGATTPVVRLRVLPVLPASTNLVVTSATAATPDAETTLANNSAVDVRPVAAQPNLKVTLVQLSANPDPAFAGGTVSYRATLTNAGSLQATGVRLSVAWDGAVAVVDDLGGATLVAASTLEWTVGTLAVGPALTFDYRLLLNSTLPAASNLLTNTATGSGLEPDAVPADNSAQVAVPVAALADLVLSASVSPTSVSPTPPGGLATNVTYRYDYRNDGSAPAEAVFIRSAYDPALLTFVSGGQSDGSRVEINIGTVAAGAIGSRTSTFTALFAPPPPVTLSIVRSALIEENVFGTTRDANPADNTSGTTLSGCYIALGVSSTSWKPVCSGSSTTLIANAGGAAGLTYSWTVDGGVGVLATPAAATTLFTPPTAASDSSYVARCTVTDPGTGCTREATVVVSTEASCSTCPCGTAGNPNPDYVNNTLERADQPANRTVDQGEVVSFRMRIKQGNDRAAFLLAGPGNTRMSFAAGGQTYSAWLATDTFLDCNGEVQVEFVASAVPPAMPTGNYTVSLVLVTSESASGPPCSNIRSRNVNTGADRVKVTVPGPGAADPGIDFTDWGPLTQRP